jgi:hypothetical protein
MNGYEQRPSHAARPLGQLCVQFRGGCSVPASPRACSAACLSTSISRSRPTNLVCPHPAERCNGVRRGSRNAARAADGPRARPALRTGRANGAGRGWLKSDTSLRPTHPPRALILATGEERPPRESLIARLFLVEVAPGDIDLQPLSACQRDAACGFYAQPTAGYSLWLGRQSSIRCAPR